MPLSKCWSFGRYRCALVFVSLCLGTTALVAQLPGFGRGGPGGGGPGGGPTAPDIELVEKFDKDQDGLLNRSERQLARRSLQGQSRRGPGRGPGGGGQQSQGKPGPTVRPQQVKQFPDRELYDPTVLRTIFLEFENKRDWEQELADFKPTDVEVPAKMIVDGETYPNVGVSFRGASSFFSIPSGSKRSINLSVDFMEEDQRLYGYKTLNLLNCNGDASMMSSYLYHDIASKNMATPKVNFVKLVINGRSWGIYANAQQFNKDFLKENYDSKKGARWKVNGSPQGDGGLRYMGTDLNQYRARYELKSKESEQAWLDLVALSKTIQDTPTDDLEQVLEPILDVDGALWFLAVDVALVNSDGYWTRASDYSIYQNKEGVFHVLPHDMNESFRADGGGPGGPGGPGGGPPGGFLGGFFGGPPGPPGGGRGRGPGGGGPGGGGPGGGGGHGGVDLDPLIGLDNARMPLRSKLLANANLRERYLKHVQTIADQYLDWNYLGPKIAAARELIDEEVKRDTRKLMTYQAFVAATGDEGSLREFCDQRRKYLLSLPAIQALDE